MRPLPGLAVCLSAAVIAAAHAQQPPPKSQTTFVSEVELVEVDVSVLDNNRLPVRGLAAADFTILEDGKPRPVVTFASVDLPDPPSTPAAWVRSVAPDVVTNAVPEEGRLVVIMMDSSVTWTNERYARAIGAAIVDEMGPADLGAVVYSTAFAGTARPQNFTTDHARLRAAVNHPFFGMSAAPEMMPARSTDPVTNASEIPSGADPCTSRALDTIAHVADSLAVMPHRRKLLFVVASRLRFQAVGPCSHELKAKRERLFRALDVANVTVHGIDPNGLEYVGPKDRLALLQRQGDLDVLPERTGGRLIINTNGQSALVPAIFRESRSYYLLGFQPASPKDDGSFHTIDVQVRRRGVRIHARRGYYARTARADAPTPDVNPVTAALSAPLPSDDISLGVTATPIATSAGTDAAVAIVLRVDPARAAEIRRLDVLIAAFDQRGTGGTVRQEIELDDRKDEGRPSEIVSRMTLKPGMYEIRAAVHEPATNRTGSVYTYVDVPDFAKSTLSLSGLALASQPAWPTAPADLFADLLPIVPTTQRTFGRDDQVSGFLKIHQTGTPRAIVVTLAIADEAGRVLMTDDTSLGADRLAGTPATADYRFRLPNAELKDGEYLLTIDAAAGSDSARREVRFSVRSAR